MSPDDLGRRALPILITAGAVMGLAASSAQAHGVGGRMIDARDALAAQFRYADGEPMAFAEVKVSQPGSAEGAPAVVGRSDQYGRYAFLPDRAGSWRLEARDGEGHVARLLLEGAQPAAPPSVPIPTGVKAAAWLSLTANIAIAYALLRRRRPGPSARSVATDTKKPAVPA